MRPVKRAAFPLARHVFPQTDADRRPDVLGSVDARLGRRVVRLLEEIRQEERAPTAASPAFCGALFAAVLALLASGCRESDAKAGPAQLAKETLKPTLDHLDAHLGERISMQTLRAVSGKSPRTLTRLFFAAFGTSPIDYLIERRLDRAALLRKTTQLPVSQIAASCGFNDASHLARTFRRHKRARYFK